MTEDQNIGCTIASDPNVQYAINELLKEIRQAAERVGVSKGLTTSAIDSGRPGLGQESLDDLIRTEISERFYSEIERQKAIRERLSNATVPTSTQP